MIELPTEAIGFHGTHRDAVSHLLAGNLQQSDQHFEWLGTGFYLWQDSPLGGPSSGRWSGSVTMRQSWRHG